MHSWPEAGVPAAQGRPDWTRLLQGLSTAESGRSPGGRVDGLGLHAGIHCLGKSSKCFLQKLRGEQGLFLWSLLSRGHYEKSNVKVQLCPKVVQLQLQGNSGDSSRGLESLVT